MYDKDFAELVKIAAEKLKEDTVYKMLIHSKVLMLYLGGDNSYIEPICGKLQLLWQ